MPSNLFTILSPQGQPLPIVANLPHSGLQVPAHIAAQFTPEQRQSLPNSDWHLQELYRFLPSLGVTVMQANYSRYVVDLNRALKPPLFGSFWSAAVPEKTAFKKSIYTRNPSREEVRSRIDEYYYPYHRQLTALLNETIEQFVGQTVYLLDLHSFMGLITDDVCLGNANDTTCSHDFIEKAEKAFAQQGYQVVKNKVFTGGYITRHYGQQPPVEALQIEIRYPVYLSGDQLEIEMIPTWQGPQFELAVSRIKKVFESICDGLSYKKFPLPKG